MAYEFGRKNLKFQLDSTSSITNTIWFKEDDLSQYYLL